MAETHTTEKDHTTRRQVPVAPEWGKIFNVFAYLDTDYNELLQWPTDSEYNALSNALVRFQDNRVRFGSDNSSDQVVLKKHLAFTLFAPGGKASRARKAVDELSKRTLVFSAKRPGPKTWEQVSKIIKPHVRFYNNKTEWLKQGLEKWDNIQRYAKMGAEDVHHYLKYKVHGLGPKATAHFMRNTGLSHGYEAFPIIDVHIHKALEQYNFQHDSYMAAEKSFRILARFLGTSVLLLDACLWCGYAKNWNLSGADFDNFGL